ncbi:HAD family hydrolase [uncultured Desulfovibrio sp.]|uniref:HAD family hydrolase n=1 Tax=uncultured Desulfovibrio sp. TaxID=167968 RepID=UPI0021FFEE7B|nr:HAD family hydrolase [uncultured Desulfovibrio sp.]CAI3240823.1 HAD-superfamily hydrolase, subfamily IA, variant 1 [Desulfovibrio diazotrophicus]
MSARLFPHGLAGVIFDCDGVLLDSRESNSIFYNRVLAVFGLPPMTPEQEKYCFMATAGQALRHIVPPALHQRIDEVVSHHVVYDRDIVPLLRLQEGFRPFVDDLRARGVRMAVHTNRRLHGIQRVLDIFALPSYFDPVVAADTAAPKPSPEGAQRICAAWGCNPADVLFVGDSEHDKTTAEGAGVVFAAFNAGPLDGQIKTESFDELHAALAEALPGTAGRSA